MIGTHIESNGGQFLRPDAFLTFLLRRGVGAAQRGGHAISSRKPGLWAFQPSILAYAHCWLPASMSASNSRPDGTANLASFQTKLKDKLFNTAACIVFVVRNSELRIKRPVHERVALKIILVSSTDLFVCLLVFIYLSCRTRSKIRPTDRRDAMIKNNWASWML
jgi:hypothetical protein